MLWRFIMNSRKKHLLATLVTAVAVVTTHADVHAAQGAPVNGTALIGQLFESVKARVPKMVPGMLWGSSITPGTIDQAITETGNALAGNQTLLAQQKELLVQEMAKAAAANCRDTFVADAGTNSTALGHAFDMLKSCFQGQTFEDAGIKAIQKKVIEAGKAIDHNQLLVDSYKKINETTTYLKNTMGANLAQLQKITTAGIQNPTDLNAAESFVKAAAQPIKDLAAKLNITSEAAHERFPTLVDNPQTVTAVCKELYKGQGSTPCDGLFDSARHAGSTSGGASSSGMGAKWIETIKATLKSAGTYGKDGWLSLAESVKDAHVNNPEFITAGLGIAATASVLYTLYKIYSLSRPAAAAVAAPAGGGAPAAVAAPAPRGWFRTIGSGLLKAGGMAVAPVAIALLYHIHG